MFRQFTLTAPLDSDVLTEIDDTSTTTQSPKMFEDFCINHGWAEVADTNWQIRVVW